MAWDPLGNLVKSLGLDPEQLKGQIAQIASDFVAIKENLVGAREAIPPAVLEMRQRFDTIEARLDQLVDLFIGPPTPPAEPQHLNGAEDGTS
jgi:hypothetical protein